MVKGFSALQLALLAEKAHDQRQLLQAEPIAVVGVGCRFPGGEGKPNLETPEAFWQFLCEGGDGLSEVPASRWPIEDFFDASPGRPGKMHFRRGGFLADVDQFDPASFGVSPREAQAMDPQHRLILEVAQEALETAAIATDRLKGTATGVFMGICTSDYSWRQLRSEVGDEHFDLYFASGSSLSMAPGRLSYLLGLTGPSLAVDTACSSSLVTVDLACRSLRDRGSDLALAGGVSLILSPVNSLCLAKSGMMAADGRCKSFDAAADGYVRSEGCGVVVLKRLADAMAAGDPIWAVLRGSGVNQDGATAGLTVPSGEAQAALMRQTLALAQLEGDQIDVLEAHGTGTALGDPIELKALAPIYASADRDAPLLLGSVKTNIGHLEGASGIAGLIKGILMVQKGLVPPHLHLRRPTPLMDWDHWALRLPDVLEPWPRQVGPRRAAVSSFGWSGTNAHVILEQAPVESILEPPASPPADDWLLLSAPSEGSLHSLVERYASWLPGRPQSSWQVLCATSREGRRSLRWRLALKASSPMAAAVALSAWLENARSPAVICSEAPATAPRLAWDLLAPPPEASGWVEAWQHLGVEPSAVVHGTDSVELAHTIAALPSRPRLVEASEASAELTAHGYGFRLPLEAPGIDRAVELWLAGCQLDWRPLSPRQLWPRQVLPSVPFERGAFWIEEHDRIQPKQGFHLDRWRCWTPLEVREPASDRGTAALILLGGTAALGPALAEAIGAGACWCADLSGLDAWLDGPLADGAVASPPVVVLLAGLEPPAAEALAGEPFWEEWLPLLRGLLERSGRLEAVHWALSGLDQAGGEALAALARCWIREAGPQGGALLWCDSRGSELAALLHQAPALTTLEERRLQAGQVERVSLDPAPPALLEDPGPALRAAATVLISGGLGALGLATARWLVGAGSRHLVLLARRPANPAQLGAVAELEALGATVTVESADVADGAALEAVFARIAASRMPLQGLIHAAGVLDDGLLVNQTPARCAAVAAAKVLGAQHLDRLSRDLPLDFFLCYSSVAGLLGSPGQAAYGAANGALDGLMAERRAQGLPALSINWGPWAGEGMAAGTADFLRKIKPDQALASLERWMGSGAARAVVVELEEQAHDRFVPRFKALTQELTVIQELEGDSGGNAAEAAMVRCLVDVLAELGGYAVADLQASTDLQLLGMDSMMAVELATAVQAGLGVSLGLGAMAGDPTLGSLASHLLLLLGGGSQSANGAGAGTDLARDAVLPDDWHWPFSATSPSPDGPGQAVLMTGATGFLGAHLLADQLERWPDLRLLCLARADSAQGAQERVQANLRTYGLWREAYGERIVGVAGDLARPCFGLDGPSFTALAEGIDGILHNGAQLSYTLPYSQLRAANVGGTLEVLRLATGGTRPLPVQFISSTAVAEAAAYRDREILESDDLAEWQGIVLGYSQTKWVSERLVLAAAARGLPVTVYRPSLIGGHSRTGVWNADDYIHRLVRGGLELGQTLDVMTELDLVPVDYVSASVGALAWKGEHAGQVFHLNHPQPVLWRDLLAGFSDQSPQPVPLEDWLRALSEQPANPLYPLLPFFSQRWGSEQLTYSQLMTPGLRSRPSCRKTEAVLRALGVVCPSREELIESYSGLFLRELSGRPG
jgi:thioester reductase-like protein